MMLVQYLVSASRPNSARHVASEPSSTPWWASRFADTLCGQYSVFREANGTELLCARCEARLLRRGVYVAGALMLGEKRGAQA